MISSVFVWIPALVLAIVAVSIAALRTWQRRANRPLPPLPTDWRLSPRPVFSADERRVYRLLREALPDHAILAKLPLVRFSQPDDPGEVRYWYELLAATHVAFAVCSASGRVLAAIDLDAEPADARRTRVKQAVLGACRVRYVRCGMDNLPSVAELRALVPPAALPRRAPPPPPPPPPPQPPIGAAGLTRPRSAAPAPPAATDATGPWRDAVPYADSFFALENRADGAGSTDFAGLGSTRDEPLPVDLRLDDAAGIVTGPDLPDPRPRDAD